MRIFIRSILIVLLCSGAFVAGYGLRHLLSPSESLLFVNASEHDAVLGYVTQEQGKNRSACFRLRPGASAAASLDLDSLPHISFFASNGTEEHILEDYIIFPAAPRHLITRQRSIVTYTGTKFTRSFGNKEHYGVARKNAFVDMNCIFQTNGREYGAEDEKSTTQ